MELTELVVGIILAIILLLVLIPFSLTMSELAHACDNENLETKVVIVENKFTTRTGFFGSDDRYHFLDENGIDYVIWGSHDAARYVKLELNQSYQIKVNTKLGFSCEEVLIERRKK